MNYKKIIAVWLIISILFTTLVSPISYAVSAVFGPDNESVSVNWYYELTGGAMGGTGTSDYFIETVWIEVTESGNYEYSSLLGKNAVQSVICGEDDLGGISPLAVSTYVSSDGSSSDFSKNNSTTANSASVYLEKGQKYCAVIVADGAGLNSRPDLTGSESLIVNLKHIEAKDGETLYQTDISSMDFTAPTAERIGWYNENAQAINKDNILITENIESKPSEEIKIDTNGESTLEDYHSKVTEDDGVSWFEKVLTFFALIVCDGFRNAIYSALGDISIDGILFNDYSKTRLAIFNSGGGDSFLESSGMVGSNGILERYFILFRNIAIACYLVMFLYMGVRILLASTGAKKDKYKTLMMDWLKGVLILALFPYVMKYTIVINDGIVDYIKSVKTELPGQIQLPSLTEGVSDSMAEALDLVDSDIAIESGNLMGAMRSYAMKTGRLAYAMLYLFLIKELLGFVFIYFKRIVVVIFLITIFPLVTISYAVDKIGDGKSQAFNNWFSEYVLNIFMQAFQAVNYLIVMSVIFALTGAGGTVNVILVLIGLQYISKGDELLRGLFSKMSGGGANSLPSKLSDAVKTMAVAGIAGDLVKKAGSAGKRVSNLKNTYQNARNSYYNLQEAKHEQSIREKEITKYNMEHSYFNPEKLATDDVAGNINKAFNLLGAHSPEDVKTALDRLNIARNDPERMATFEKEYNKLSDADKQKLDKLLAANDAINQTVNGNKNLDGAPLTNMEININANINLDIVYGRNTGLYKDLYAYANSKTMKDESGAPIKDRHGRDQTLNDFLFKSSSSRTLNGREQQQLNNAQKFIGNVTQIDTSRRGGNRAGTNVNRTPFSVAPKSASEEAKSRSILRTHGTAHLGGVSAEIASKQEKAANFVARMQNYKFMLDSGATGGVSVTEAKELSNTWNELAEETDAGVQAILAQVGDASAEGHSMEADVGFTREQFTAMTSLGVIKDKRNLVGTEEEKAEMVRDSTEKLIEIATGKKRDKVSGNKKDYKPDKVSRAIVERAEIDDLIDKYKDEAYIEAVDYVRSLATQEEIRDAKAIAEKRAELEREYDKKQKATVAQARGQLIRDSVKVGGAAASVAAVPLSISTGIASAALYTGMSGKLDKPVDILAATAVGVGLEHTVEKLIPGTEPATSSKKSVGSKIDNFARGKIDETFATTPTEKNEEFLRRQRIKYDLKAKNDRYRKYLK